MSETRRDRFPSTWFEPVPHSPSLESVVKGLYPKPKRQKYGEVAVLMMATPVLSEIQTQPARRPLDYLLIATEDVHHDDSDSVQSNTTSGDDPPGIPIQLDDLMTTVQRESTMGFRISFNSGTVEGPAPGYPYNFGNGIPLIVTFDSPGVHRSAYLSTVIAARPSIMYLWPFSDVGGVSRHVPYRRGDGGTLVIPSPNLVGLGFASFQNVTLIEISAISTYSHRTRSDLQNMGID
jgi:hypothetical protein